MASATPIFIQCKGGQGDRAPPRATACEMPLRCAQQPAALPAPIARDPSAGGADRALCACDCVRAVPPAAELRAASTWWHAPPKNEPNDTEVLFFSFLLVAGPTNAKDLHQWAAKVRSERVEALEQQTEWRPTSTWDTENGESLLFKPLRDVYSFNLGIR